MKTFRNPDLYPATYASEPQDVGK